MDRAEAIRLVYSRYVSLVDRRARTCFDLYKATSSLTARMCYICGFSPIHHVLNVNDPYAYPLTVLLAIR